MSQHQLMYTLSENTLLQNFKIQAYIYMLLIIFILFQDFILCTQVGYESRQLSENALFCDLIFAFK